MDIPLRRRRILLTLTMHSKVFQVRTTYYYVFGSSANPRLWLHAACVLGANNDNVWSAQSTTASFIPSLASPLSSFAASPVQTQPAVSFLSPTTQSAHPTAGVCLVMVEESRDSAISAVFFFTYAYIEWHRTAYIVCEFFL